MQISYSKIIGFLKKVDGSMEEITKLMNVYVNTVFIRLYQPIIDVYKCNTLNIYFIASTT